MCCVRNPGNINNFVRVPDREDRGDREIVYVPNVYVPFLAPKSHCKGCDLHNSFTANTVQP